MHLRHGVGCLQLANGRPQHACTDCEQNRPQRQGCGGFKPLMAVGMVFVGVLLAVVAGEQHNNIRHQVRQRMNAVGYQRL